MTWMKQESQAGLGVMLSCVQVQEIPDHIDFKIEEQVRLESSMLAKAGAIKRLLRICSDQ